MKATRVLGLCGLISACAAALGGFFHVPELVGVSGTIMIIGNLYAIFKP